MNTTDHQNSYLLPYNSVILINSYNNAANDLREMDRLTYFVVVVIGLVNFYIHLVCYHCLRLSHCVCDVRTFTIYRPL